MRLFIISLNRSGGFANRKTLIGSDIVALSPSIISANKFTGDISLLLCVRLPPLLA
jgi:hypothetical protein